MAMQFLNSDILLYIGMADAYGAGVEYLKLPRDQAVQEDALRFYHYVTHPTHNMQYGAYTDDTEMSIANTRVLLENDPPYTPLMFAEAYVQEFNRGGRRNGYARSFQKFLESVRTGNEFLTNIQSYSRRNGACMRAVPLGTLPHIHDVLEIAAIQASVTHNTLEGILSSEVVALMSHYALYEATSFQDIGEYCLEYLAPYRYKDDPLIDILTTPWLSIPVHQDPYGCEALTTIHAVTHLLTHETSLMRMLEQIIRWGGDTDSVAAITWGIASARYQDEVLPEFMEREIEDGSVLTGAIYLKGLGMQLMNRFVSSNRVASR